MDFPQANRLTVHILAVAEHEAKTISTRTKDALAAAKAGAKANNRNSDLVPITKELKAAGAVSLRQIAAELNAKGIKTARGKEWSAVHDPQYRRLSLRP